MDADEDYAAYVGSRWAALVRSAVMLGCTRQEAEDLVKTTLMRCYVSWVKVARAADRDAYVYRALVNAHTSSRKRRWWSERPSADLPESTEPLDATARVDLQDALDAALAGLSRAHRTVVVLRYVADLTERQTADVLGVPTGTVKSRLARGLAQLATDTNLADLPGWSTP